MTYPTLDHLPDLTYPEMGAARYRSLKFDPYTEPGSNWDFRAMVRGVEPNALLHDKYAFNAIAGATYDIVSITQLDPYLLVIYDEYGNAIVANSEADDGPDVQLIDGAYYGRDIIFGWVAPYTGLYYVAASWNQGSFYSHYSLFIYEDRGTIGPLETAAPQLLAFTPADGADGLPVTANFMLTFNEPVQRGAGTVVLKTSAGAIVETFNASTSPYIQTSHNDFHVFPSKLLEPGVSYKLEVGPGAVKDLAGNSFAGTTSYNFTTALAPVVGTAGNDALYSTPHNEFIDGNAGIDTAVFSGTLSQYTIERTGSAVIVSGPNGVDTLEDVERLLFGSTKVAIDVHGSGGMSYRLYQAAFDRTPDIGGVSYWLGRMDGGAPLTEVAAHFIGSPEFQGTYGPLNNTQFAAQLYRNVLHREPDAGGLAFWTEGLNTSRLSRPDVLVGFSESNENQANLIGVIENGFAYL